MNQRNPGISKGIDWLMVWIYIALCLVGLLCIFSVEYRGEGNILQSFLDFKKEYSKQFFFLCISLVVAIFILLTDSKFFTATANLSYLFGIGLIMATFVVGKQVGGSKSWIPLGFMNIQPVEVCKIFTSLAVAKYLSMPETDFKKTRSQLIGAAIAFAPAALSVLQKEPGAAIVYFSFTIAIFPRRIACEVPAYFYLADHIDHRKYSDRTQYAIYYSVCHRRYTLLSCIRQVEKKKRANR